MEKVKSKAKELIQIFGTELAVKCVEQIIDTNPMIEWGSSDAGVEYVGNDSFWLDVKNEISGKNEIIEKINTIIIKHGSFTVADVEAESSPILEAKGKLTHLAEDFMVGTCVVYVYDPTSYTSDEIDTYDEFYETFELSQLKYILELAEKWEEQNE